MLNPSSRCGISLWHNLFPEGADSEFEPIVPAAVEVLSTVFAPHFYIGQGGEALAKDVLLSEMSVFQQQEEAENVGPRSNQNHPSRSAGSEIAGPGL
jgi:hypothetical protein